VINQDLGRAPMIIATDIGGDSDDAIALAAAALTIPVLALVITDECNGQRARFVRHFLGLLGRDDVAVVAGADLGNTPYFYVDGLTPRSHRGSADRHPPRRRNQLHLTQLGGAINYRDPTRAEHNFRLDTHGARAVLATMPHVRLVISDTTFTDELAISAQSPLYKRLAALDPRPGQTPNPARPLVHSLSPLHPAARRPDPVGRDGPAVRALHPRSYRA
jgi:pyrimidine-specific ribonucleoside hydrolase